MGSIFNFQIVRLLRQNGHLYILTELSIVFLRSFKRRGYHHIISALLRSCGAPRFKRGRLPPLCSGKLPVFWFVCATTISHARGAAVKTASLCFAPLRGGEVDSRKGHPKRTISPVPSVFIQFPVLTSAACEAFVAQTNQPRE